MPEKGVAMVEDDVPGPWVKALHMPAFSPDSRHLAYLARQFDYKLTPRVRGPDAPVSGGRQRGEDAASHDLPMAVSPDGAHVARVGLFRGEWHPVFDERLGPGYSPPFAWSFDADGLATWYLEREAAVERQPQRALARPEASGAEGQREVLRVGGLAPACVRSRRLRCA